MDSKLDYLTANKVPSILYYQHFMTSSNRFIMQFEGKVRDRV